MQIKIANFDLTPEIRGYKSCTGFSLNGSRVIQTVGALRADFVEHFDRDNKETVLSFGTHHEFETIEDAQAWLLDLDAELPTQGLVEITLAAGSKTIRRWIADAVIPTYSASATGLLTIHQYEIRGGLVLKEAPTT